MKAGTNRMLAAHLLAATAWGGVGSMDVAAAAERTVAEWRFDQLRPGSSTVRDVSGNGHDLKLRGDVELAEGTSGRSLRLSGANNWAEGPSVAAMGILGEAATENLLDGQARGVNADGTDQGFVVEAVVRPRALAGEQVIVESYEAQGDQRSFSLSLRDDRAVFTFSADGTWRTALDSGLHSNLRLVPGEWNRIRVAFDGRFVAIEINGEHDTAEAFGPGIFPANRPIQIGRRYDGKEGSAYFTGDIASIRLAGYTPSRDAGDGEPAITLHPDARNNLVIDLLETPHPQAGDHRFEVPTAGWVFFELQGIDAPEGEATLSFGGGDERVALSPANDWRAMRRLPAGSHALQLDFPAAATPEKLVIRRVPELGYIRYGYGSPDWRLLSEHVLPHANFIVSGPLPVSMGTGSTTWYHADGTPVGKKPMQSDEAVESWTSSGRDWLLERASGYWGDEEGWAKQFDIWKAGFTPPLSGALVDEFGFYYSKRAFDVWSEVIARLHREYPGPRFFAYMFGLERFPSNHSFINQLIKSDDRILWELYIREEPTEAEARRAIGEKVIEPMRVVSRLFPDLAGKVVFCPSIWTGIGSMTDDFHPEVDQKVFLDLQFHAVATHPDLRTFGGYAPWTSGYSSEEMIRWVGALYEHYGIRGETEPLSERMGYRYVLDHLDSYGFENPEALTLRPASADSLAMQRNAELPKGITFDGSFVQPLGEWSVRMTRSAASPNEVRQPVRNLEPGELYSVTVYLVDLGKPAERPETYLPLSITLRDGEMLDDRSEYAVIYSKRRSDVVFLTRIMHVFRATGAEDELTLSDWVEGALPPGREGELFVVDNVTVEPYFAGAARHAE